MQIITVPLLSFLMPLLIVLGLFGALWGCQLPEPKIASDDSRPVRSRKSSRKL